MRLDTNAPKTNTCDSMSDCSPTTRSDDFRAARQWIRIALVATAVVIGYSLLVGPRSTEQDPTQHAAVGRQLPMLNFEPLTGASRHIASLDDVKGRVVLVNFWGPWCGYCLEELPHLMEIADSHADRDDFLFLPVAYGAGSDDVEGLRFEANDYLSRHGFTTPTYYDPETSTFRAAATYGVFDGMGFPTTFLLDRDGAIRAVWTGYRPGDEAQVNEQVDRLLAEQKVDESELPQYGHSRPIDR